MIALLAAMNLTLLVGAAVLAFLLVRASRRLLEFDELFNLLSDDMETNVKYFTKLLATPTFLNSPEVVTAQRNMTTISRRLDEFVRRFSETTRKQSKEKKPPGRPPVVA